MYITGMSVCVNFRDFLERGIDRWMSGLNGLVVVTDESDSATAGLMADIYNRYEHSKFVGWMKTEAFYESDAIFNKASAICQASEWFPEFWRDWCLFFDADIVPPENWREMVEEAGPQPGNLYGAPRFPEIDGVVQEQPFFEYELAGYFQLFHSSDKNVQRRPLLETNWRHAGGYDSEFQSRWQKNEKIWLPMKLIHVGEPGRNWWGRGNHEATEHMLKERRATGMLAHNEKIQSG